MRTKKITIEFTNDELYELRFALQEYITSEAIRYKKTGSAWDKLKQDFSNKPLAGFIEDYEEILDLYNSLEDGKINVYADESLKLTSQKSFDDIYNAVKFIFKNKKDD